VINDPIEVREPKVCVRAELPDPGWDPRKGRRLSAAHLARMKFPCGTVKKGSHPGMLRYPEGEVVAAWRADRPIRVPLLRDDSFIRFLAWADVRSAQRTLLLLVHARPRRLSGNPRR